MRLRLPGVFLLLCACRPGAFDALGRGKADGTGDASADGGLSLDSGSASDAGSPSDASSPSDANAVPDAQLELDSGCGDIRSDVNQCGACDVRCVASPYGLVRCSQASCLELGIQRSSTTEGPLRGGVNGGVYPTSQLCPNDEVLIGISGLGDTIAYSFGVRCARLALSRTSTGFAVQVVPNTNATPVGGNIQGPPPSYTRTCPEGSIVTGVATTTWLWPGAKTYSVRQIALSCSHVSVDAERHVLLSASETVTIGDTNTDTAMSFSDVCTAPAAVAGFTGLSGAYIDAMATHCGELIIGEKPAATAVVPAD